MIAAEVFWEAWADSRFPSSPMSHLSAFLAGSLGHCARVLCPVNFSVSECIPPVASSASRADPQACSGAHVVAAPHGFELRKQVHASSVGEDTWDTMIFQEANDARGPDGTRNPSSGACWVYPGEHMSFSLLARQQDPWAPNSEGGSDSMGRRRTKRRRGQDEKETSDAHLAFNEPVGSLLHVVGIDNFFHVWPHFFPLCE
jgi:hypothetical protein